MTRTHAGILAIAAVAALGLGLLTSGERQQDVAAAAGTPGQSAPVPAADLVIRNARIYTQNPQQPEAASVAIRDGAIVAVGDDSATAAYIGE